MATRQSHRYCDHENTSAARARCRREREGTATSDGGYRGTRQSTGRPGFYATASEWYAYWSAQTTVSDKAYQAYERARARYDAASEEAESAWQGYQAASKRERAQGQSGYQGSSSYNWGGSNGEAPRARGWQPHNTDRISRIIQGLQAKADHPNTPPAEAQACREKIANLKAKHNRV